MFKIAIAWCLLFVTFSAADQDLIPPKPPAFELASEAATAPKGELSKPRVYLESNGGINNGKNWNAHGNAGLNWKVWESQNQRHSVGLGAHVYTSPVGRYGGMSIPSNRGYSAAAVYSYKFGRRG